MNKVFREEAVKNKRSAKRLDSDIRIVSVRMWIVLVISLALISTLIIWGIIGKVPITTEVMGVYIYSNGNMDIRADKSGIMESVPVMDTYYNKGDVLCTMKGGSRITAPSFCSVRKLFVNPGEWVQEGEKICSCARHDEENIDGIDRAYLYVPYDERDRFDYYLPVSLDAVGVSEKSSLLQGFIAIVGQNVVSEEMLKRKFGMDEISEAFSDGKPKIELVCAPREPGKPLDDTPKTEEELRQIKNKGWSYALAEDIINSDEDYDTFGMVPDMTLVKATVTLEYRRPITFLIPALDDIFKPIPAGLDPAKIEWDRDFEPVEPMENSIR